MAPFRYRSGVLEMNMHGVHNENKCGKIPCSTSGLCLQDGFHFKLLAVVFTIFYKRPLWCLGNTRSQRGEAWKCVFAVQQTRKLLRPTRHSCLLLPVDMWNSAVHWWPISQQNQALDKMVDSALPTFPLTPGNHLHLSYQRPSPFCGCLLYSHQLPCSGSFCFFFCR